MPVLCAACNAVGTDDDDADAVNLPPTLSKSQVSSVRKNLKMQMLALLRMPDAAEFRYNITTLLTDLGATQSEVVVGSLLFLRIKSVLHKRLNSLLYFLICLATTVNLFAQFP